MNILTLFTYVQFCCDRSDDHRVQRKVCRLAMYSKARCSYRKYSKSLTQNIRIF